jgi:hypothetical protein
MSDETDLRERFAELREEQEARTPGFDQVLLRARPVRSRQVGILAAAACLALAAIVLTTTQLPHRSLRPQSPAHSLPHSPAPALADWRAPTDFLLNTEVSGLLHAVPQIGPAPPNAPTLPPQFLNLTPTHRAGTERPS